MESILYVTIELYNMLEWERCRCCWLKSLSSFSVLKKLHRTWAKAIMQFVKVVSNFGDHYKPSWVAPQLGCQYQYVPPCIVSTLLRFTKVVEKENWWYQIQNSIQYTVVLWLMRKLKRKDRLKVKKKSKKQDWFSRKDKNKLKKNN